MLWIMPVAIVAISLAVTFLLERKIRQAKIAAKLRIRSPRGIVEEGYVRIGGVDQWINIRGEDRENPVLLILHGGPGCSYSIFTPLLRAWETHFTVVQWDQRGSGRTFARLRRHGSGMVNLEQLTRDAVEVAEHLRMRMGKERIFLLGSSVGTLIGLRVVRRRPDLFYAYIGTDQNVGMARAGESNFREVVERLRALGLRQGVEALERIGPDSARWSTDDFEAVTRWTMKSDPQSFQPTMKLLKNSVWYAPGWTLKDIRTFVAGMRYSLEQLLPEMTQYDAWQEGTHFEVPIFIFQGEADVLTSPEQAQAFFEDIVAPAKQFVLIADTGHFAAFLQPEEFLRLLLLHIRPLADAASSPQLFEQPIEVEDKVIVPTQSPTWN